MQQLEVAHHFCLKRARGLPHLTRSDMVLGLAGITSFEALIDLQKLAFLGSLCHAPTVEPCHTLFILRLCKFDLCENRKIGLIPDIVKILQKYNLEDYLTTFKTNSLLPSKEKWKSVCKKAVRQHETRQKKTPEQPVLCSKCTHKHMHIEMVHALFECPFTDSPTRIQTFSETVQPLSAPLHEHLKNVEPATLVLYLMGMIDDVIADLMPIALYPEFLINCANFLQSVLLG
ncbi:hypothetical protein DPMN_092073 [Dreissena polymorpha]|uniref:Uncharacterized protein n=1 Tax=Dreissena polymorpha TaxID=45954 RepID=A0A9D4L1A7_DREPO|nr:hypothetical protein DPMN_092073 [Dreissena polymorpha]